LGLIRCCSESSLDSLLGDSFVITLSPEGIICERLFRCPHRLKDKASNCPRDACNHQSACEANCLMSWDKPCPLVHEGNSNGHKAAKNAWHAMQIANAAGVAIPKEGGLRETDRRQQTCATTNDESTKWSDKVCGGTNGHTTGQSGILNWHSRELSVLNDGRESKGCDRRSKERQHCIDKRSGLPRAASQSQCTPASPEETPEDGAQQ